MRCSAACCKASLQVIDVAHALALVLEAVSLPTVLLAGVLRRGLFAAAAAEFNRYNARKIVIADEAMGEEKLVGWFRTNEPESFARAAASSFGGKVSVRGDVILVEAGE